MTNYIISYRGNSTKHKNTKIEASANSAHDALRNFWSQRFDDNNFPQENGDILDCDGNLVAAKGDDRFSYDGGYFVAAPVRDLIVGALINHFAGNANYSANAVNELIESLGVTNDQWDEVEQIVIDLNDKFEQLAVSSEGASMQDLEEIRRMEESAAKKIGYLYV